MMLMNIYIQICIGLASLFFGHPGQGRNALEIARYECKSYYNSAYKIKVFTEVDEPPEFPGGTSKRMRFLIKHLKYPQANIDSDNLQSSVAVRLVIDIDGRIRHAAIDKKNNSNTLTALESEVLRVIDLMPTWAPGKCNGKAVLAEVRFPIIICFSED